MIPTGQPPHKTRYDSATDRQRLDMLSLAAKTLKPEYNVVVSDIEIRRGGKSYTVDTVAELLPRRPDPFRFIAVRICF